MALDDKEKTGEILPKEERLYLLGPHDASDRVSLLD